MSASASLAREDPPSNDHVDESSSDSEGSEISTSQKGAQQVSQDVVAAPQDYDSILSSLESQLTNDFPQLQVTSESSKLSNIDSAEARLALVTAALSSYCGALLLENRDPATHSVVKQLNEAKRLMGRLAEVRAEWERQRDNSPGEH